MSIFTNDRFFSQAIVLKQTAVEQFINSADFKELEEQNLVAAEFESKEGHKLYLFSPTKSGISPPQYLDPEEYVWIQVGDEDGLGVEGYWEDFPFDLDIDCRMSVVVHSADGNFSIRDCKNMKEYVAYLRESFDISKLDFEKDTGEDCEFGDCGDCLLCQGYEDLSTHDARFFNTSNLSTTESTDEVFLALFCPDLKAAIKYKDIIEDITEVLCDELDGLAEVAYSTWWTHNYELIKRLCEEEKIEYDNTDDLTNHPSIVAYGASDHLHDCFEGNLGWHELELPDESTGIRIVRSTVEIGKATPKKATRKKATRK
jgi:hypothetical protein